MSATVRPQGISRWEALETMNSETAINNFHQTIIRTATEILGRPLTEREKQFVTSRGGFIALETILDTIRGASKERVEQYLNSEASSE